MHFRFVHACFRQNGRKIQLFKHLSRNSVVTFNANVMAIMIICHGAKHVVPMDLQRQKNACAMRACAHRGRKPLQISRWLKDFMPHLRIGSTQLRQSTLFRSTKPFLDACHEGEKNQLLLTDWLEHQLFRIDGWPAVQTLLMGKRIADAITFSPPGSK